MTKVISRDTSTGIENWKKFGMPHTEHSFFERCYGTLFHTKIATFNRKKHGNP